MSATLNIIIEYLRARGLAEPFAEEHHDESFRFDHAVLLRAEDDVRLVTGPLFSSGIPALAPSVRLLFVGTEDQLVAFARLSEEGARMLCVCSGDADAEDHDDERILRLRSDRDVAEIFAAVCRCEAALAAWVERMERDLLEGKGYQGVIDRAEALIGNPMVLSDAGFRILAHTHALAVPERTVQEAIERGSFSHSSMESFRRKGRPRAWRSFSGINILDQPTVERPYPVVNYVFRVQGRYFMHLVMHCSEVPYSFGMRDLLQMLVDVMEMQIRRIHAGSFFEEGPSFALARLVAGAPSGQLLRTLGSVGIAREGEFRAIAFEHGYGSEEPQLPVYAAFRVMEEMPSLLVGMPDGRIMALWDASRAREDQEGLLADLEQYCQRYGCRAGVSDAFESLEDASFAYRQASFALEAAGRRTQEVAVRDTARSEKPVHAAVFTFDECFADFAVLSREADEDLLEHCMARSVPVELASDASRSDVDDHVLLRAYLDSGLRPSAAADAVHLHRTTLLYRLERIAKRFSMDLSDPVRTQRLSMEYRLMDLGYGRTGLV